jgi:hypothetical protein
MTEQKEDLEKKPINFPKIDELNVNIVFKARIFVFFMNLVNSVPELKLDYDVVNRGDDVLLVIRNMQSITTENMNVMKYTKVVEEGKTIRSRLVKDMTIEDGILYIVLTNDNDTRIKCTKEDNRIETAEIIKNKKSFNADIDKLIFYFNNNDIDLQAEFYRSEYCKKAIKIWETLYSDHLLIEDNTQIIVEDSHYEIFINNITGIVNVPLFFNKITKFNKENRIYDSHIVINKDRSVSIGFDLRVDMEVRNDTYRLDVNSIISSKIKK